MVPGSQSPRAMHSVSTSRDQITGREQPPPSSGRVEEMEYYTAMNKDELCSTDKTYTRNIGQKKQDTEEHVQHNSIYIKFKTMQNPPVMIKNQKSDYLSEGREIDLEGARGSLLGPAVFYLLIWLGVSWVSISGKDPELSSWDERAFLLYIMWVRPQ